MYYVYLKKKIPIYLEWGGPNDNLAPWLSGLGGGPHPPPLGTPMRELRIKFLQIFASYVKTIEVIDKKICIYQNLRKLFKINLVYGKLL